MSYYRLYILNDKERIRSVVELHCANDADACSAAAQYAGQSPLELWSLDRRVGRITSGPDGAAHASSRPGG